MTRPKIDAASMNTRHLSHSARFGDKLAVIQEPPHEVSRIVIAHFQPRQTIAHVAERATEEVSVHGEERYPTPKVQ